MVLGWLGGKGKVAPTHSRSLTAIDELAQIQDAMSAVTHIMADDIDSAKEHLQKGHSPFHQLGVGVCMFMRATLGFEQDVMREANDMLYAAENGAYDSQRRVAKDVNAFRSSIYPPGTEYAVCQAEAQLMSAVVGVLNESLTEALKSFYKLRKAYITLESVMEAERTFLRTKSTSSLNSSATSRASSKPASIRSTGGSTLKKPLSKTGSLRKSANSSTTSLKKTEIPAVPADAKKKTGDSDDDLAFVDAEQERGAQTPLEYTGHLNLPVQEGSIALDSTQKDVNINASTAPGLPTGNPQDTSVPDVIADFENLVLKADNGQASVSEFTDHPIDEFIISGASFCFGMLLVILSMVPPAFASVLKVIGFKGDKDRGLRMLWQATKFNNIHGAMAGVVLMGYFNGFVGFCDIIPQTGEGAYPERRCKALMAEMRRRYPKSHLWLLEEARMMSREKQLETSVEYLEHLAVSPFKQLEALSWFERALDLMYLHDYTKTSTAFQTCITLNNWSHGLYHYICGASYVELYRRAKVTDPDAAKTYANKANEFFKQVIPNIGKKKFMGRQLPFDTFVHRKISRWEARAKEWNCDFIDAIGVSPIEEMIYFWNGYKRMRPEHLQHSLENLAWSESSANPHWAKEDLNEKAILSTLRAVTLRSLGQTAEAKEMLQKEVISHDATAFAGTLKDDWMPPVARYEMAACMWQEADADGNPQAHQDELNQCKTWLEAAGSWGSYALDARIGMKITTGKGTLRRYGIQI
ncbi:outer membrane protein Iml2/Tetratricopeptide repeat protein 39 [Boeremia exigua]|uniref:outer membrane protein Iml2/Tetratricopeptide repeat protein 39 n=1 Tax=Boeremia exigua TaxID=749465 RepID=UPI001E8D101D|nr:outer membrane protein Iml2/Tetratricopeptide repeat protein 39 [Boeremia exigua]KAH6615325.1 outer membrane protein Iml2/Tetratricopeptide repeat protein 39 [Boeremia exigua]